MLGSASPAWEKLVGHIRYYYAMDEVWYEGNPAHKHYNNLSIKRGGKTLVTLSLREGHFMVTIVLGKDERDRFDLQREEFGEAIRKAYDEEETLHDGKWLGFDIHDESLIDDIARLLPLKRKPNRKALPESIEQCGTLDIGLSHEEITNCLIPT